MTITIKQLLWLLGGLLLGIALILGFMPVKAGGVGCGTALTGRSDDAYVADLTATMIGGRTGLDAQCDDGISSRRTTTFALGIPGAVLLGIAALGVAGRSVDQWERRNT